MIRPISIYEVTRSSYRYDKNNIDIEVFVYFSDNISTGLVYLTANYEIRRRFTLLIKESGDKEYFVRDGILTTMEQFIGLLRENYPKHLEYYLWNGI